MGDGDQSWLLEDRWNLGYSLFILLENEQINSFLKGQFTHKSKIRKSPLTCRSAYVSIYFYRAWSSFGATGLNIMDLDGTQLVALKTTKKYKTQQQRLSRDPDPGNSG